MHIAICLWGIVRSLRYTVSSIQQYVLQPIINGGHTYEIYMHTYKFSGVYQNSRSREVGMRLNFTEWKLLNPDHIYVEDQDLFDAQVNYTSYETLGDPWRNDYDSFMNHLRALNSLFYLASKVEKESQYKQFDGVVFLRPDATYLNELPYYLLEHIPNTLFVPDFHRSCKGGEYNDRMAMGDLKSAVAYGKRFENALEYSKRKPLHSEKFTYDYLQEHQITVKEIPFRFKRTRANGEYHVRDDKAIVSPRQQKPEQEYTTSMALRLVYTVLEEATEHKVYIWNHDDHENLYCKPNPYISLDECMAYRKKSRRSRIERDLYNYEDNLQKQRAVNAASSLTEIERRAKDALLHSFNGNTAVTTSGGGDRTTSAAAVPERSPAYSTSTRAGLRERRERRIPGEQPRVSGGQAADTSRAGGAAARSAIDTRPVPERIKPRQRYGRSANFPPQNSIRNTAARDALPTGEEEYPVAAAAPNVAALSPRGMGTRELEESQARLKKIRNLKTESGENNSNSDAKSEKKEVSEAPHAPAVSHPGEEKKKTGHLRAERP